MLRAMAPGDWIDQRGWMRPDLGGACFASLPGTVTALLGAQPRSPVLPAPLLAGLAERYQRVVLVYFDAFGFDVALRHGGHPLLERAAADGVFAAITSQFPSTTTVHMTTIHTGLSVAEHGLYEWFLLEPELERLISPLPFAFAGDGQGPLPEGFTADRIYPPTTLYELFAESGVASAVAGPLGVAQSPTSAALVRGSIRQIGFLDVGDGLAELAAALSVLPAPAYGFAYIDLLDTLLHKVGPLEPASSGVDAEVTRVLDSIQRRLLESLPDDTLVLITADHGMSAVSPQKTIYVNEGPRGPEIRAHLRREPSGHPLAPAGSCRDLFLHAKPGHADDLVAVLTQELGPRAEVHRAEELIAAGLFGPHPSKLLLDRLGDVAVLPALGEAVYWHTPGRFLQTLWGQHGGLTAQEMEIPLIAVETHR
jgi:hypothetical protein